MKPQEHIQSSTELIISLFKSAPQHLTSSATKWMWVLGYMASILTRLSRTDPQLRRELDAVKESTESKKK